MITGLICRQLTGLDAKMDLPIVFLEAEHTRDDTSPDRGIVFGRDWPVVTDIDDLDQSFAFEADIDEHPVGLMSDHPAFDHRTDQKLLLHFTPRLFLHAYALASRNVCNIPKSDEERMSPRTGPSRGSAGRGGVQREEAVVFVVAQAAEHGGEAAQGGLGADAAGVAEGDELGQDFDDQDVGDWLRLGHDGTPVRPEPGVGTVGDSEAHRAQARQGLVARVRPKAAPGNAPPFTQWNGLLPLLRHLGARLEGR